MKKLLKNEWIQALTLVLGLSGAFAHRRMMSTGLDDKGLLIPGNPVTAALWVLCLGYLSLALVISLAQTESGAFRAHFPPCKLRGTLSVSGGLLMILYGVTLLLGSQPVVGVLAVAAGISMAFTGLCRFRCKHPNPMFHCCVCVFFIVRLVLSFRNWSADPQLQDYVLPLLASLSLMLFAYHRASSDANQMTPKRTAFFSLCAAFFCLASLADASMRLMHLGAGLWAVGAAPTLEPMEHKENENP